LDKLDSVLIFVNRSPFEEFMPQRRLRQEDPLTSFLFIIAVERLSGMMREAISKNMFKGFKVETKEVEVNLL